MDANDRAYLMMLGRSGSSSDYTVVSFEIDAGALAGWIQRLREVELQLGLIWIFEWTMEVAMVERFQSRLVHGSEAAAVANMNETGA